MIITDEIRRITDIIIKTVPTEKIYLFGSYVNGNPNNDSDYDLYVVIPNGNMRPIEAIGNIYMALCGMKRRPVDILAGTVEIFDRRSKQITIERTIEQEGVIIYEHGK